MKKLIVLFLIPHVCFAFSWKKCDRVVRKAKMHPVFSIAGTSSSTSSYVSSTGDCALIGAIESERPKIFIVDNLEHLRKDVAKGAGEYLTAFTEVCGCKGDSATGLVSGMRKQYDTVFKSQDPRAVYSEVVRLNSGCTYL